MQISSFFGTLSILALVTGCGNVVPMTLARLSGLSPLTADPAGFAVIMDLPAGLDIPAQGARLTFTVNRPDETTPSERVFHLQRLTTKAGSVFRIAPEDVNPFRRWQRQVSTWKAEDGDATSGSLGIELTPCLNGSGLDPDAQMSVSIQLTSDSPALPLLRGVTVRDVQDTLGLDMLPPCI